MEFGGIVMEMKGYGVEIQGSVVGLFYSEYGAGYETASRNRS